MIRKNKKIISLIVASTVFVSVSEGVYGNFTKFIEAFAETKEEWKNQPDVYEINREEAHATFVSYKDSATALDYEKKTIAERGIRVDSDYHMLPGRGRIRWEKQRQLRNSPYISFENVQV